jgi:bacterial/archaeal transporter family-2 protein
MKLFFYFLPVLCGVSIAVQSIINGQLRVAIGSPLMAAFISFFTGTLFLLLLILTTRQPAPSLHTIQQVSWIKWTGGLLGAFFVTAVIVAIQKIPSANLFALIITGQFITALLIDHFGLFGAMQSPAHPLKLAGVVLLIGGAYLIIKK